MFILPDFKKPYNAFEPFIDEATMKIHHQLHHGGYVNKLNQAIVDENLSDKNLSLEEIFAKINEFSPNLRNNAGGHYNHSLFWTILNEEKNQPSKEFLLAVEKSFESFENFEELFKKAALSVFGSGWAWLVLDNNNELKITTTKNQDNPLMSDVHQGYPLFGVDVWEHAYYLRYQNKRGEYLDNLWKLLDWKIISERFQKQTPLSAPFK